MNKKWKFVIHGACIVGLYLFFSFAMFLGLQVSTLYGNIAIALFIPLLALYLWWTQRK